jgi:hypothetical protein
MKDKWSSMSGNQLRLELKKIMCERVVFPRDWYNFGEHEKRQMRRLLRFLYLNLKEEYINSIKLLDKIEK